MRELAVGSHAAVVFVDFARAPEARYPVWRERVEGKSAVWLASGVRTPFARVDGALTRHDSLTISVPVARAMVEEVKGPIDFAIWGSVILNLAYNNLAREIWLEVKLDPHVPTFTTIMQCSTSMLGVFEAAGMLGYGGTALAMAGGVESMSHVQVGLRQNLSDWLRWMKQAHGLRQRLGVLSKLRPAYIGLLRARSQEPCHGQKHGRALRGHGEDLEHHAPRAGRICPPKPPARGRRTGPRLLCRSRPTDRRGYP